MGGVTPFKPREGSDGGYRPPSGRGPVCDTRDNFSNFRGRKWPGLCSQKIFGVQTRDGAKTGNDGEDHPAQVDQDGSLARQGAGGDSRTGGTNTTGVCEPPTPEGKRKSVRWSENLEQVLGG